jgi:CPA1 family monovalent cation:H+ antiporter
LAVVVCGLAMSQIGPRIGRADTRAQTTAFWSLATFLLNSALFVLVGLEAHTAVRGLVSAAVLTAIVGVVIVCAVLLVVRFAFLVAAAYTIRLVDRRPSQRLRRVSNRARVVSTVAGFRGAVSLAVALSVPATLSSGEPFPDRDLIIFITAGVVAATLVVQGLILPVTVRWARLPVEEDIRREQQLADRVAVEEALAALSQVADKLGTDPAAVARLRNEYEDHLQVLRERDRNNDPDHTGPAIRLDQQYTALRLALLARKREAVLSLRDQHRIDDTVLVQIQSRLDIEELRLSRGELTPD